MALSPNEVITGKNRKETKAHGSAAFPCAAYERTLTDLPGDEVFWHWHEEMEIIYIMEGEMELKVLSWHTVLKKGEMALINSNALHYARAAEHCIEEDMVFSKDLITGGTASAISLKYVEPLVQCRKFVCLPFAEEDENIQLFARAFQMMKNDEAGYELAVRDALSHIVLSAYFHYEKDLHNTDVKKDADTRRIAAMLAYIHRNYDKGISLSDIASQANIGEREALRCFKRTIHDSPMQYLLKYRLMCSVDLLKSNEVESISEVSAMCGFASPAYYAKKFRELYHCTPRKFMKLSQKE